MRVLYGVALALLGVAAEVQAVDAKVAAALAQQRACLACHAPDRKLVGPSYKDIARKYKGNAAAVETLAIKIRKGGAGVWGNIPMPANRVTEAEARLLAQWVLGQ